MMRKRYLSRTVASVLAILMASASILPAGAIGPASAQESPAPVGPERLDQLMAPIALYPDPLLAQILMAATYPLEVVEASRWLENPGNAALRGDALDAALQQQNWEPSVKSLVPFPQILQLMNGNLEWTQALGDAFISQPQAVMDSAQRLRAAAERAGTLQSTPQQMVSNSGGVIVIQPANPEVVYVPYYNPTVVYGTWSYPSYPPVYFAPPRNYHPAPTAGIYFGAGLGVVAALWGWDRWDWHRRQIAVDPDRYNRINNYVIIHDNHPRYESNVWQHDPSHRRGVPYGGGGPGPHQGNPPGGGAPAGGPPPQQPPHPSQPSQQPRSPGQPGLQAPAAGPQRPGASQQPVSAPQQPAPSPQSPAHPQPAPAQAPSAHPQPQAQPTLPAEVPHAPAQPPQPGPVQPARPPVPSAGPAHPAPTPPPQHAAPPAVPVPQPPRPAAQVPRPEAPHPPVQAPHPQPAPPHPPAQAAHPESPQKKDENPHP